MNIDKRRITLVGQAPSGESNPRRPLAGRSGDRVCAMMELVDYDSLARRFVLKNVLPEFPRAAVDGDLLPAKAARLRARRLQIKTPLLVMLGKGVANAFGCSDMAYFEWFLFERYGKVHVACVVPHPSGKSRWWNDLGNRARGEAFFMLLRSMSEERKLWPTRRGLSKVKVG